MTDHLDRMKSYYQDRAPVYDRVYAYPERQMDLRTLEALIPTRLEGSNVLEIAAGTGYWTQFISRKAKSILATDGNPAPLEELKKRPMQCPVETRVVDAYQLEGVSSDFDGAFAGLWLSHVPRQRWREFMECLHQHLAPSARVILIDNSPAQCIRLPVVATDDEGNTWQDRELDDGSIHRVLKNFPTESELMDSIADIGHSANYQSFEHFWFFQYTTSES